MKGLKDLSSVWPAAGMEYELFRSILSSEGLEHDSQHGLDDEHQEGEDEYGVSTITDQSSPSCRNWGYWASFQVRPLSEDLSITSSSDTTQQAQALVNTPSVEEVTNFSPGSLQIDWDNDPFALMDLLLNDMSGACDLFHTQLPLSEESCQDNLIANTPPCGELYTEPLSNPNINSKCRKVNPELTAGQSARTQPGKIWPVQESAERTSACELEVRPSISQMLHLEVPTYEQQ
jgi:hypothetical protein